MQDVADEFGIANPRAPEELLQFAFLIGRWSCQAKVKNTEGVWHTARAEWVGRFILDGYAIADEYRMTDASGEVIVLGMNFRSYDAAKQRWNVKWLHAQSGTWTDLVSERFGGIAISDGTISYAFPEPMAHTAYSRATYTNISPTHFTWIGEKSEDCETWTAFLILECERV